MEKRKIIEIKDVWKIYQLDAVEYPALRGANLDVYRGEFLAIMGASGSGKSTMLNSVGALDVPTKGQVLLEGIDISTLDESELSQVRGRKIGFVFQAFNLINSLSALENVMLPMTFQNIQRSIKIEKATRLLNLVGLGDRLNNTPGELSGGERQRVAIARSLANDPEVILADEPTGNLDSKTGKEILELLKRLQKEQGKTLIMVTHDLNIAKQADRIAQLSDGKVIKISNKI
ncbi:MAG: ABC transporter ATP-binding protein [Candidatus Woesearchaeota archaeon]|nr:ABC transporter ATP-binding protein [Candidatus Woesearchaeota archaeon]